MTAQPHASRRLFLAAGSAATLFGALSQAAAMAVTDDDPIFAALERHKAAERAFIRACELTDEVRAEQEGREVTEGAALRKWPCGG